MPVLSSKTCAECGDHFLASRPAWRCSGRCRQRAHRRRLAEIVADTLAPNLSGTPSHPTEGTDHAP